MIVSFFSVLRKDNSWVIILRIEDISDSFRCLYDVSSESFSDIADIHFDYFLFFPEIVYSPDFFSKLIFWYHASMILGKIEKEIICSPRKHIILSTVLYHLFFLVYGKVSEDDLCCTLGRHISTGKCLDPSDQFTIIKRLPKIIISSRIESFYNIFFSPTRSKHDNGYCRALFSESLAYKESIHNRNFDIEEYHIVIIHHCFLIATLAVLSEDTGHHISRKIAYYLLREFDVVFDKEEFHRELQYREISKNKNIFERLFLSFQTVITHFWERLSAWVSQLYMLDIYQRRVQYR